jgi:hypothetical protein
MTHFRRHMFLAGTLVLGTVLIATPAWAGVLFDSTSDRLTATTFTVPTTGTFCFNVQPNWASTDSAFARDFWRRRQYAVAPETFREFAQAMSDYVAREAPAASPDAEGLGSGVGVLLASATGPGTSVHAALTIAFGDVPQLESRYDIGRLDGPCEVTSLGVPEAALATAILSMHLPGAMLTRNVSQFDCAQAVLTTMQAVAAADPRVGGAIQIVHLPPAAVTAPRIIPEEFANVCMPR